MTETEIVVQDIRRELRLSRSVGWQPPRTRQAAHRPQGHGRHRSIDQGLHVIPFHRQELRQQAAFNRVQLSARTLCDELKKWELAHAWQ